MSEKKELNKEELEKVTGGEETATTTRNVVAKYQDEVDGVIETFDLGRFEITIAETTGETMAKNWCISNNKIYCGWYLANLLTNNYETRILLDELSKKARN